MAKARVEVSCKHCGAVVKSYDVTGHNRDDANRKADYYSNNDGLCEECAVTKEGYIAQQMAYRAAKEHGYLYVDYDGRNVTALISPAQQKELEEKQEKLEELQLPELEGSERQVSWANDIRNGYMERLQKDVKLSISNMNEMIHPESMPKQVLKPKAVAQERKKHQNELFLASKATEFGITVDVLKTRMERVIGIVTSDMIVMHDEHLKHASAKYWIDNRDDMARIADKVVDNVIMIMLQSEATDEESVNAKLAEEKARKEAEAEAAKKAAEEAARLKEEEFQRTHTVTKVLYKVYKASWEGKRRVVDDSYDARTKTIEVYLTEKDIANYENWLDHHDHARMNAVTMPYKEYKKDWSKYDCEDYDRRTGTCTVYLPKDVQYERKTDKHYEERHEFREGFVDEVEIVPDVIDVDSVQVVVPDELLADEVAS